MPYSNAKTITRQNDQYITKVEATPMAGSLSHSCPPQGFA